MPGTDNIQLYIQGRSVFVRSYIRENERYKIIHAIVVADRKRLQRILENEPSHNFGISSFNQPDVLMWMVGYKVHFKRSVTSQMVERLLKIMEALIPRFSPHYPPMSYFRVLKSGTVQLVDHRRRKIGNINWRLDL